MQQINETIVACSKRHPRKITSSCVRADWLQHVVLRVSEVGEARRVTRGSCACLRVDPDHSVGLARVLPAIRGADL